MKSLINKFNATIILIGGIGIIGGCAISNEGRVDFRKASVVDGFQEGNALDKHPTEKTNKLLPLKWKNFTVSKKGMFVKGDSISLHLRTVYIKDFAEIANPLRIFTRGGMIPNGEIAIVTNVIEEEEGKTKELDFKSPAESGRLVFYSDDVRKGQPLNFTNMPIYGPITYNGGPLALRISIFELDVVSEQAKALIGVVAQLGSTAYAPAAPVLGALNKIGQGLAGGEQNDKELMYWMVLDPSEGSHDLNHFTLEVGNYVFVRSEDRTKEIPWNDLVLNENEQILYWKKDKLPYEENTYFVVEIQKAISSMNIDLSQSTFSELLAHLQNKDKERAGMITALSDIKDDIAKMVLPRIQNKNFNLAKELLNKIKNLNASQKQEREYTVEKLVTLMHDSLEKKDGKTVAKAEGPLSITQIEYLLSKLRELAPDLDIGVNTIAKEENISKLTDDILAELEKTEKTGASDKTKKDEEAKKAEETKKNE